jgi:LysM repeat protein
MPGDTLSEIAELCGTTVDAIMAANPQITDPTKIFVGQTLRIPRGQNEPVLAISIECGPVGTELHALGSGYLPNSNVEIRLYQKDRPVLIAGQVTSDVYGRIETDVVIPSSAVTTTPFYIIAEGRRGDTVYTGTSPAFYVIAPTIDPNAPTTYISQPGDTLRSIANKYNRSLDALYEANPQITDPFELPPGQRINIPAQPTGAAEIKLAPVCGPAETDVQVTGDGFPPGATVDLYSGPYLSADVHRLGSDSSQAFATNTVIPFTAVSGQY